MDIINESLTEFFHCIGSGLVLHCFSCFIVLHYIYPLLRAVEKKRKQDDEERHETASYFHLDEF